MIIIVGNKLRRMLPADVFENTSDPLAHDQSEIWTANESGQYHLCEPSDPNKDIWCAEVTVAGRGKDKKVGVLLMSANSGFIVMSTLPTYTPVYPKEQMDYVDRNEAELKNREAAAEYRKILETTFIDAIRKGMLDFCLPEHRVLDYISAVGEVEFIKGRRSMPGDRLKEFIVRNMIRKSGDDPVKQFDVKCNRTERKFGNSCSYRDVANAVRRMLDMNDDETLKWMDDFTAPVCEENTKEENIQVNN